MTDATGEDADVGGFVADLVRIGVDTLAGHQLPREQAAVAMQSIAEQLCAEYARRRLYVPVSYDPRNRQIVDKYHRQGRAARPCTPERIRELAEEFELTERRIYVILAEARAAEFAARQGQLPGFDSDA